MTNDDISAEIKKLAREAKRNASHWKAVAEAMRTLRNDSTDVVKLAGAAAALAEVEGDPWADIRQECDRRLDRARMKATMKLSAALDQEAQKADVEFSKLSDHPLVFALGELAVRCEVQRGEAVILFGREPCTTVECDRAAIVRELDRVKTRHAEWRRQEASLVFERLASAYRIALARAGASAPARADLVDLVVPLAWIASKTSSLRSDGVGGLDEYGRERLVVELYHLRRSGALEREGLRLDLGVATGNATSDKDDVLYVPTSPTDGQYYATIRFTEQT